MTSEVTGSQQESCEPREVRLEEQPLLKKPKLESEKEGVDDMDAICDKIWLEYRDEVEKSGVRCSPFPNISLYGLQDYRVVPCDFSNPRTVDDIIDCSTFAIEEHNKLQGTKYELYRVVKANVQPDDGPIYFITLLAEDLGRVNSGSGSDSLEEGPHGGPLVELQAKVFQSDPDNNMEYLYTHVKDNLSEEGRESHMKRVAYDMRRKKSNY